MRPIFLLLLLTAFAHFDHQSMAQSLPPKIAGHPKSHKIVVGQTLTLSVTVKSVEALSYQWLKDEQALPGATQATLTLENIQLADAGAYAVTVQGEGGSATSKAALVTVIAAPVLLAQPLSQTVMEGASVAFSVDVQGTPPFKYQWKMDGKNLPGGTKSSFAIKKAAKKDQGKYSVTIQNGAGEANSAEAQLTVNVPPSIIAAPKDQTLLVGGSAAFAVQAAGDEPISYQWRKDNAIILGATGSTYTLENVQEHHAGKFWVVVKNPFGRVNSAPATLTVQTPPEILVQPVGQTVLTGQTVAFWVRVNGTGPFKYQWKNEGKNVPGGNLAVLVLSKVSGKHAGVYVITVESAAGSVTSQEVTLTVNEPAQVMKSPKNQIVAAGSDAVFSVEATGTDPISYQWYKDGQAIESATQSSLTVAQVDREDAGHYWVVASNPFGQEHSSAAVLKVKAPPLIDEQPQSVQALLGDTVLFSVAASSDEKLKYQWKKEGQNIPKAREAALVLAAISESDLGSYSVEVQNPFGSVLSSEAQLTLAEAPVIVTHPSSQTVTVGADVSFSVSAAGSEPLSYQWLKDGEPIPEQTQPLLHLTNVQLAEAGSYSVEVSNLAGAATSQAALLTINPLDPGVPPVLAELPHLELERNSMIHPGSADLRDFVTDPDSELATLEFRVVNLDQINALFGLSDGLNGGPEGIPVVTIGMDPDSGSFRARPGPGIADNTIHAHPRLGFTGSATVIIQARDAEGNLSNERAFTVTVREPVPPPTPALAVVDAVVMEGNQGTAEALFPVHLSAASGQTVTVQFQTQDGTAKGGEDYTAASGTLTFDPGETIKSITVLVQGDTEREPEETFLLQLSNPAGATLAIGQATGTILDDDNPPAISSFAPTAAEPGSPVVIHGSHFNSMAAVNRVWFGPVRAAVTAATSAQLTVSVPAGAAFGPITVQNASGLIAVSSTPFRPAFAAGGALHAGWFASQLPLTTGIQPHHHATGDIDGDGKPELIVANHGSSANSISVFRNLSTPDSIGAESFAKVDFATPARPAAVGFGDMDGDGRPDLVVITETTGTMSVFRNTSTLGVIDGNSLAARVDFSMGGEGPGKTVVLSDLDGDGQLDVAVANRTSVVVRRNISTPGSVAFESVLTFAMGGSATWVIAADVDEDGKLDLIGSNRGGTTVSVRRNIASPGSLTSSSFGGAVDFTAGSAPLGTAWGDIDGDGKQDLVVANESGNTISILRNTSTPGVVGSGTFAAKVDFAVGARPEAVALGDLDGDGKLDIAVVNQTPINDTSGTISVFRNLSTSGSISLGARFDLTVGEGPLFVSISDLDLDGRPELIANNYTFTTVSPGTVSILWNTGGEPTISSLSASSGAVGDSITIHGSRFSSIASENIVWFGPVRAAVTAATPTQLTVTVPPGTTYAPISVTTPDGLTASSSAPFIPAFLSGGVIDSASFAASFNMPVGGASLSHGVGDLDGDGKPDLVAVSEGGKLLAIYRNVSASGSLSGASFDARVDFTTGHGPRLGGLADIDGDGKLDVVIVVQAVSGNGSLQIYRNLATSGSFDTASLAAPVSFAVPDSQINMPAIVDLDGDGKLDVAVPLFNAAAIAVYRNTSSPGSISFLSGPSLSTGTAPGGQVVSADLDGDGKNDLIVGHHAGGTTATVSVFRNTSQVGSLDSSSFATRADFTTGPGPGSVTVADIDGDGKPDVISANFNAGGTGSISVLRNTSTSGISFAEKVDFTPGGGVISVAAADLNGDGKVDLVTAGSGPTYVNVLRNTSSSGTINASSFAPSIQISAGVSLLHGTAVADLDLDGKPEILNSDGSATPGVSIIRNIIGPAAPAITSLSASSGAVGDSITIHGSRFSSIASGNIVYFGPVRATVTAATATQLTVTVPAGAALGRVTVTTAHGLSAVSSSPFVPTFSGQAVIDASSFAAKVDLTTPAGPSDVLLADFDGDGKPDLAAANNAAGSISFFRNISSTGSLTTGSFGPRVDLAVGPRPFKFVAADLDGDGKLDLAFTDSNNNTISVFRNTSVSGTLDAGSFGARVDFATGSVPKGLAVGDLDGDGKLDLVAANLGGTAVSIFRNTSTPGSFTTSSLAAKLDLPSGTGPVDVAIRDFDGDGKPDLAVVNQDSHVVSVHRNISIPGSLASSSFAAKVDFAAGTGPGEILAEDFDGDGKPDLAVVRFGNNAVGLFRNTAIPGTIDASSFAARVDLAVAAEPQGGLIAGDVDGDGRLDLIVPSNTVGLSVFRNISTAGTLNASSFAARADFTAGSAPRKAAVGDLDLDGRPELLSANSSSGTVSILRNLVPPPEPVITSLSTTAPFAPQGLNQTSSLNNREVALMGASSTPKMTEAEHPSDPLALRGSDGAAGSALLLQAINEGAAFRIVLQTVPGQRYHLEFKDSLRDPSWQPLGSLLGDGGEMALEDSRASAGQRFYRVRVLKPTR